MNGWEMLNLKEKWPNNFFGPNFNPNNNYLPKFNMPNQSAIDLAYNQSLFLKKSWKTFNIMGLELDYSQKDKVRALWQSCRAAGKLSVKFLNSKLGNPNNYMEAIRVIPFNEKVTKTEITLAPYNERRTSTDKYTMIIANSSGGTIGVSFDSWRTFGWGGYKNLSAKFEFLSNTTLYGAARRGDKWRGVKITFK